MDAFSRKAGDMTFQIGIIDWETKKETWRSQPLSSADGGCSFRFMLNDSDDKTTPYEDIRSHLAAVVTGRGLCRTGGYPGFYIDSQIVLNM